VSLSSSTGVTTFAFGTVNPDIDGGTIDGTRIGSSSAADATFSTIIATKIDATKIGTVSAADATFTAVQTGLNGTDGKLVIYSEEGGSDQIVTFLPNSNMTEDTSYTLPPDNGDASEFLQTDGSGNLTWVAGGGGLTINSTSITSGTQNRILFENSSNQVSEDADLTFDGTLLKVGKTTAFTPNATTNITAGGGITVTNTVMRIAGSPGAVTITASPNIALGTDGQMVILKGESDTNTVTLRDEVVYNGSALSLNGQVSFTLGQGDTITLVYDLNLGVWFEISRTDNTYTPPV
jgi:hypothetical protein